MKVRGLVFMDHSVHISCVSESTSTSYQNINLFFVLFVTWPLFVVFYVIFAIFLPFVIRKFKKNDIKAKLLQ